MEFLATCMDCGWTGTMAEGAVHDDDDHLVVYNPVSPTPARESLDALRTEMATLWDDGIMDLPCGCG